MLCELEGKNVDVSLIFPYLLYGAAMWGGAYKTYLDRLFVIKKKLLLHFFVKVNTKTFRCN